MQTEIASVITISMHVNSNEEDTTFAFFVGIVIKDVDIDNMIEEQERTILCLLVMITMINVIHMNLCD